MNRVNMTPAELAAIRERLTHGGVWSQREVQMKADIAHLVAEFDRLTAELATRSHPRRATTWKPSKYGGEKLYSDRGASLAEWYPKGSGVMFSMNGAAKDREIVYARTVAQAKHLIRERLAARGWVTE